jgi:hypothetical protein
MSYTSEQLSDLEQIRQLVTKYTRGVDRLDSGLMKSAYWSDATDNHGRTRLADEFVDYVMSSHAKWQSTMHCIYNHTIELDPENASSATGELYNVSYLFGVSGDGSQIVTWYGRYIDEYEKRDEEWRILRRICVHACSEERAVGQPIAASAAFRQDTVDRGAFGGRSPAEYDPQAPESSPLSS